MQNESSQKPGNVSTAIVLLWALVLLGCINVVFAKIEPGYIAFAAFFQVFITGIFHILISYRQNWARMLFAIVTIIGIIIGPVINLQMSYGIFQWIAWFISSAASIVVIFLLFSQASKIWFSGHSENNQYQSVDRIKCPFCAEWVASEAKICKHCQRDLPAIVPSEIPTTLSYEPPASAYKHMPAKPLSELEKKRIKQAVLSIFFTIIAIFGYNSFENTHIALREKQKADKLEQEADKREQEAAKREQQAKAPQAAAAIDSNMVRIPGKNYEIGKYEVTLGEWKAVMGSNPSHFKNCGDTCPVENVSWKDAQEFLQKLNSQTGKQYRLPTEAEWEYACYGGSQTEYCGGGNIDSVAWYYGNSNGTTHPVGQKQANGYGLYDMSGNVSELIDDCWEGDCAERVRRGGSWFEDSEGARVTKRGGYPVLKVFFIGFRLARMLP